ncbi:VanZ family protein [Paenibacillus psychroresistens]|nr:VanZ family protein [Paenibacillus psychroresistens]
MKRVKKQPLELLEAAFVFYLLFVIYFVFIPIDVNLGIYSSNSPWYNSIHPVPFINNDIPSFTLNMIMMVPLGFFLPLLYSRVRTVKNALKIGLFTSLGIEVAQLIMAITLSSSRTSDINDLIANSLGCAIGFILIKQIMKVDMFNKLILMISKAPKTG